LPGVVWCRRGEKREHEGEESSGRYHVEVVARENRKDPGKVKWRDILSYMNYELLHNVAFVETAQSIPSGSLVACPRLCNLCVVGDPRVDHLSKMGSRCTK
jgi:hypothetical protein